MLDTTRNTLSAPSGQVADTTTPESAELLHRVRLAAEAIERSIYDLESIRVEFAGDVPDEIIWNMMANLSGDLESIDFQCAIEELVAEIRIATAPADEAGETVG
jgi:hypothetical protein